MLHRLARIATAVSFALAMLVFALWVLSFSSVIRVIAPIGNNAATLHIFESRRGEFIHESTTQWDLPRPSHVALFLFVGTSRPLIFFGGSGGNESPLHRLGFLLSEKTGHQFSLADGGPAFDWQTTLIPHYAIVFGLLTAPLISSLRRRGRRITLRRSAVALLIVVVSFWISGLLISPPEAPLYVWPLAHFTRAGLEFASLRDSSGRMGTPIQFMGFAFGRSPPFYRMVPASAELLVIPFWFLAWVAALAVALFFRGRRMGENICHTCGYDLRATPDRCPDVRLTTAEAAT